MRKTGVWITLGCCLFAEDRIAQRETDCLATEAKGTK
jgi:hypothetical protein